ncbi:MAG: CHAT domain-containing protein [Pseudomonadota bacterium]
MSKAKTQAILDELLERVRSDPFADILSDAERLTATLPSETRDFVIGVVQALAVADFSTEGQAEADLSLVITSADHAIRGSSPKHVFDIREADLDKLREDAREALSRIRNRVANLYDERGNPNDIRRELFSIGRELTDLLPQKLRQLLESPKLTRLHLDIAPQIDFPIELVLVDTDESEVLLSGRAEISRWYTESPGFYHEKNYKIQHAALAVGRLSNAAKFQSEEQAIGAVVQGETTRITSRGELFEKVFTKKEHQLLHYKGHIAKQVQQKVRGSITQAPPTLSFAKGDGLKLTDIGVVKKERCFFENSPVIFLNGCDSALTASLIGGETTFPEKFLSVQCAAVVATIWEVSEVPASEFTRAFYQELQQGTRISLALKLAREDVLKKAAAYSATDNLEFLKYFLTAHGYVYYGPADLTISFD